MVSHFALCTELPFTNIFAVFAFGTWGDISHACRKSLLNEILFNRPIGSEVRERSLSLSKELKSQ